MKKKKKNSHKNHVISTIKNVEDVEGTVEIVWLDHAK